MRVSDLKKNMHNKAYLEAVNNEKPKLVFNIMTVLEDVYRKTGNKR